MPQVVLVGMHPLLAGQEVKRSQSEVEHGLHRPAVAAVGGEVVADHGAAASGALQEGAHGLTARTGCRSTLQELLGGSEGRDGGAADGGILPAQEVLCLGGPGHELAIEAKPVGSELFPESAPRQGLADMLQQRALDDLILK